MNNPHDMVGPAAECWTRIGVWGDRSCPVLGDVVHCHNCHVFAGASRRFLEAPCPPGYLEEWNERLATPIEETAANCETVLVFRLGEEWLALSVAVLMEVTTPRPIHRIPHRAGLLAGLVNIRGELQLCVHLGQALGMRNEGETRSAENGTTKARMIVVQNETERWVFPVDEVDEVFRIPSARLGDAPATLARASGRLTRGVFDSKQRSIGVLEEARLFQLLRGKIR